MKHVWENRYVPYALLFTVWGFVLLWQNHFAMGMIMVAVAQILKDLHYLRKGEKP